MTIFQKARLKGINALLKMRGVLLSHSPSGKSFTAMLDDSAPETSQYSLSDETRNATVVSILKSELGETDVKIGSSFTDAASGVTYRVTQVGPRLSDILASFVCESSL